LTAPGKCPRANSSAELNSISFVVTGMLLLEIASCERDAACEE